MVNYNYYQEVLADAHGGNSKLMAVVSICEGFTTALGTNTPPVMLQQTNQCKEAWKDLIDLVHVR